MRDIVQAISACLGYNVGYSKRIEDKVTGFISWWITGVKKDDVSTVKGILRNHFDCSNCKIRIYESTDGTFETPLGGIN